MKRVLLGLIRLYQRIISPALPPSCRFTPTCSQYTYEAIERYGVVRGSWLGMRRLLRCHPLHPGGYDPVPEVWPSRATDEQPSETAASQRGQAMGSLTFK